MGDKKVYAKFTDEEQHERLKEIKDKHGLTWKGLLLQGARRMEGEDAI
jgi:hypothetical protein